ncbi:MAG: rhodanese-like domain-containing protein [Spirochaetaceae bacterium]|jgi:rhodanese-related sulfurtransferase|nr:rhodanese-like domain-containing protein [Spirochaetaceae bacterium]
MKIMKNKKWAASAAFAGLLTAALVFAACKKEAVSAGDEPSTAPDIFKAVLPAGAAVTPEISTAELQDILERKSAVVFDARPFMEFAVSHIPGAVNLSAKPGVSKALYISDVAEIGRIVDGKDAPIILYCNGPYCGKAVRLSSELLEAGYTNVKRYQLGIPVWRALGFLTQIEPEGARYVMNEDKTAVFIDARDAAAFNAGSLPGARNIPASELKSGKDQGVILEAKNDGRLPVEDHNTRLIVFGANGAQAQTLAEAIAKEAFHNTAFFGGTWEDLR